MRFIFLSEYLYQYYFYLVCRQIVVQTFCSKLYSSHVRDKKSYIFNIQITLELLP